MKTETTEKRMSMSSKAAGRMPAPLWDGHSARALYPRRIPPMVQCFQRFSVIQWFPCDTAIARSIPSGSPLGSRLALSAALRLPSSTSKTWRWHGGIIPFLDTVAQDTVGYLTDHFCHEQPEVGALAIIGRGDVFHAVGVGGELVALAE